MYNNQKIKNLRELKNYSQQEVADKANLSLKTYSNIEKGSKSIKLKDLISISQILEINLNVLLQKDSDQNLHMVNEEDFTYKKEQQDVVGLLKKQILTLERDKDYFMSMLNKCLKGELKDIPSAG